MIFLSTAGDIALSLKARTVTPRSDRLSRIRTLARPLCFGVIDTATYAAFG